MRTFLCLMGSLLLLSGAALAQAGDAAQCAKAEGESAIAACSGIIAAANGDISWALFDRARAYFNAKMYGSAVSDLTDLLQTKPKDVEVLENRGLAFVALDDYPRAIADFSRVIDLQPTSDGWRERCWARAAWNRDLDDALEDCDHALSLKPADALALDARCFVEFRKTAYAIAISNCSAALAADPNLASSSYLRGIAKRKSGDKMRGDADIDVARAIDPEIARTFALYGVVP